MFWRSVCEQLGQELRPPRLWHLEGLEATRRRSTLHSLDEGNRMISKPFALLAFVLFTFASTAKPALTINAERLPAEPAVNYANPGLLKNVDDHQHCRPVRRALKARPLKWMKTKKPVRRLLFKRAR